MQLHAEVQLDPEGDESDSNLFSARVPRSKSVLSF